MAYINIFIKGTDGHTTEVLKDDRVTVGRSSKCGVTIKHGSVSREHCVFVREDDVWRLEDAGSANGTRVNQDKIEERYTLKENDIVKIGKARLKFHAADEPKQNRKSGPGLALGKEALGPGGDTPVVELGPDDPAGAVCCQGCGTWFSVAHRLPGDGMACPRCGMERRVPTLVAAGAAAAAEAAEDQASRLPTSQEAESDDASDDA